MGCLVKARISPFAAVYMKQYHLRCSPAANRLHATFAGKTAQSFNDIHELDPGEEQSKWTLIHAANAPPPRARHVAFAIDDNNLLIFGGVDKRNRYNDIWIYNCPSKSWTECTAEGWQHTDEAGKSSTITPAPRAHFTASKFHDRVFIYGGYGGAGIVHGDLWVLQITPQAGELPTLKCAPPCPSNPNMDSAPRPRHVPE